ncbi:hypothetical protein FVO59_11885 [Microbacterium esteraromaticum]|uniref:Uncharacterized protein n=1 Tax=Microbacterium esteraromaticum TaxID=57043 RepID=A0A7D8AMG1_9MICO|nr:hypothetical protein [Microbacterium esteraromaticum]QMU97828.1 hypothetical protein FVO59_11885 [Microbacterium esteraromaticum]
MTEYTPTTENVRSVHAHGGAGQVTERRRAMFDRWLAAHDAEVRAGVVPEEPEWEYMTPRGFGYTEIKVANYAGQPERTFSIQQSSLATECQVWIGLDDDRAHMSVEQATRVRDALNAFLASAWLPVEQEGNTDD